jgi:hypothetical protein
MKNRSEVKQSILAALGNPSSGIFLDYIDVIVDAVVGKEAEKVRDEPKQSGSSAASQPTKETRVVLPSETR